HLVAYCSSSVSFFKISALNLVFCVTVVFGNVSLKCLPVSFNQAISAMPFFTTIFLFKRQAYKVVQSYRQDLYRRIYFVNKFDAMGRLSCSERDVIPVKANQLFEVEGAKSAIKGSRKSLHSDDFIFMDKATPMTDNDEASPMKRWRLCTVTS
ncbi:hypothetical protein S245_068051, partial [Arachis hypogaea]